MLTTLLLQKFPHMNLKYVPEAVCYTIVPSTFSVLLSQRRRWVNSTFHNMLYLLGVRLGGICCFSMKFIVILDLVGTLILPSTLLYVVLMLYNATIGESQLSMITLLVFGFSVAVQLIVPLLRLEFSYLWSAFVYCESYSFSCFRPECNLCVFLMIFLITLLCPRHGWCAYILLCVANLLVLASGRFFLGPHLSSGISTCYQ